MPDACVEVDRRPADLEGLAGPAAGQQHEGEGRHRRRVLVLLAQGVAEARKPGHVEGLAAPLLAVPVVALGGVRHLARPPPPAGGQRPGLRARGEEAVRLVGPVAQLAVDPLEVLPSHVRDLARADRRQEVEAEERLAVALHARRALRDVLVEEASDQVLDGRRRGERSPLLGRVAVVLHLEQALGGELAGLLQRECRTMLAERQPPIAAVRRLVLHHVRLDASPRHAEPESQELAVPDEGVPLGVRLDGAHQPMRQSGPHSLPPLHRSA